LPKPTYKIVRPKPKMITHFYRTIKRNQFVRITLFLIFFSLKTFEIITFFYSRELLIGPEPAPILAVLFFK
jgi:hypothetical protein